MNFTAASIADTDTANTAGILGRAARLTVANADWAASATTAADTPITAFTGYAALATAAGTDANNSILTNAGATLTGSRTTNTLKIDNTSAATQTLDLAAANTLTLTAGGLLVTGADAVNISNGTLKSTNNAATPDVIIHHHGAGTLTIGSVIANGGTGAQTLTKSGTGTLVLTGTNTYTGQTYLNGGITSVGAVGNLSTAQTNINNATLRVTGSFTKAGTIDLRSLGGTFDVAAGVTFTTSGALTGPGGFTKSGDGIFLIAGGATYTGPTRLNAGTMRASAVTQFSFFSDHILADAAGVTLDMSGFNQTLASLGGGGVNGGIVTNNGANATLNTGQNSGDSNFGGAIVNGTGTVALTKNGAGTMTLSGTGNTYTGGTNVNAGKLLVSGAVSGTASVSISVTGPLEVSGSTTTAVTTDNGGILTVDSGGTYTSTTRIDANANSEVSVSGTVNTPTFNVRAGARLTAEVGGVLGSATTLNVDGVAIIRSSQTITALNIGDGGLATLSPIPPPAPAFAAEAPDFAAYAPALAGSPQAVPEPGIAASLLTGLGLLLGVWRRGA